MTGVAKPQGLSSFITGNKQATTAAEPDPLKRDSPRSSVYNLLRACHDGNFLLASQYLDLSRLGANARTTEGSDFAKELCDFLDRDPNFEVGNLSSSNLGSLSDGLSADLELLDEVEANHKQLTLYLRHVNTQGRQVWLVSSETVARIPELVGLLKASAVERRMPEPLVQIQWIDTPLWIWIALVLLAVILSFVSRVLSRAVLFVLAPLLKRYFKWSDSHPLENFSEPVRLLLSLVVFRACMTLIPPSALLRTYIINLIALLTAFGVASLAMRIVDVIADRVMTKLHPRERTVSHSVAPLLVRFIKICVFGLAVVFVLAEWGYNMTTILAGVGVGGLAVALAAQKTIENLFGGISLISDRPVLVGDFCQFGGQVGTVEDIGLRSTRIRTLDRTLVTIPNSQFSTMTLENYSKRDRIWFHPTLFLHRDTAPPQIREMMSAAERILYAEPLVDPTDVPVRFTKVALDSYVLEVFAYVLTPDYNEFLKVQSKLLLQIVTAAAEMGVAFARPIQESVVITESQVGAQNVEVNA